MFLKSLDINGFKSFADKTHIDFTDGITSLLGPNGCGKSNIVDSIKWVLGEQSVKTLRAGKMEDVIFNGTDQRKPLQFAEVALTIDNSSRILQTDLAEIEIKRRVFRTGESEYYINRQRCLMKNIKELFFDTGIGKSAYSILEQGKIDQILSNRPEDRRYIFEEAAGISRFKVECNEAQRKIERTDENILQVENILTAEKRTYTTLKNQAEKAMAYNDLVKRQLELDVVSHAQQIQAYQLANMARAEKKQRDQEQLSRLTAYLEDYRANWEAEQGQVRERSSRSTQIQMALTRADEAVQSLKTRVVYLEDTYREYLRQKEETASKMEGYRTTLDRRNAELEENLARIGEKEDALEEARDQLKRAQEMIEEDQARLAAEEERVATEEDSILKSEARIAELSEEFRKVVEDLALELDSKMGEEYSWQRRKAAGDDFSAKLTSLARRVGEKRDFYGSIPSGSDIREKVREDLNQIAEALTGLSDAFGAYKSTIPPFIDTLLAPEGLLTRKRAISDEEDALRRGMQVSRSRIAASRQEMQRLNTEIEGLRSTAEAMRVQVAALQAGADNLRTIVSNLRSGIEETKVFIEDAESSIFHLDAKIGEINDKLKECDDERVRKLSEIEDMKAELAEVQGELRDMNAELERKARDKDKAIEDISTLRGQIENYDMWQQQSEEAIKNLYQGFYDKYARSLNEYQSVLESEELPDPKLTRNELEEVRRQIAALGPNINHMAVDDFKEAQERYEFLSKQLDDLKKAKADLEKVLDEIQTKSEEMFIATYKQISDNFQAMFKRLFNGGRAEITLADPENVLTSGIDIFAQPPGKKLISLTLLSGGERSMTAVALLFATYMVKPSPFCILDEIDAALDDKNIGYFLDVLKDFSRTSQFIIITHNIHTVMGSQSLLGVTQIEAGVSTTITYKLANIEGEAVILDEKDSVVNFDEEGRRQ